LLGALGEVLQAYPKHVSGALTGRLNGTDLALFLPAAGMAADTARSLVDALRAALATVDVGAELVVGGSEGLSGLSGSEALARTDSALARAEERGAFAIEISTDPAHALAAAGGEQQWRRLLGAALDASRTRLAEVPVLGADGRLLHLQCSLRLQWRDDDRFHPAASWLPMAQRCRLAPQADRAVLALALAAIAVDRQPRCVMLTSTSLASAGFVSSVHAQLVAAPDDAACLSIELRESAASRHAVRLRQASALWRAAGVRLGLAQAGSNLRELPRLHTLGIDYMRIDATHLQDVSSEAAVHELVRGLVRLLHGMGLQVLADGVDNNDDLAVLWQLGFDGAGGVTTPSVAGAASGAT
jgi:EAL domain-containing protein (putative c-di-GMP-specific phosphodiesterase class I)